MGRNGDGLFLRNGYQAFKYRDDAGNWHEKSTGKKNQSQALLVKAQFLRQLEDGTLPEDMATWKLKRAADHWYDLRSVTKPGKTAETERRFLKQVITVLGEGGFCIFLRPMTWRTTRSHDSRETGSGKQ